MKLPVDQGGVLDGFPTGVGEVHNGDRSRWQHLEGPARALVNVAVRRKFMIPAIVHPRVITPPYSMRLTAQREPWTKEAKVRLIYSTSTPYDLFKITVSDPLLASHGASLGASAQDSATLAVEQRLLIGWGTGVDSERGIVDVLLDFTFISTWTGLAGAGARTLTLYSVCICPLAMGEIEL